MKTKMRFDLDIDQNISVEAGSLGFKASRSRVELSGPGGLYNPAVLTADGEFDHSGRARKRRKHWRLS